MLLDLGDFTWSLGVYNEHRILIRLTWLGWLSPEFTQFCVPGVFYVYIYSHVIFRLIWQEPTYTWLYSGNASLSGLKILKIEKFQRTLCMDLNHNYSNYIYILGINYVESVVLVWLYPWYVEFFIDTALKIGACEWQNMNEVVVLQHCVNRFCVGHLWPMFYISKTY